MKTKFFSSVIAALLLGSAAQAQQVVSYFAQIPQASTNWTKTLQLPAFNPTLGTLTQVQLSYSGLVSQSVSAENMSSTSSTYDLSTTATLTLGKLAGATLFAPAPVALHSTGTVGAFDGVLDFAGTSGVTFSQNTTVNGLYVDSNLSSYLGTGLIDFSASDTALSTLNSGGNFTKGSSTSAAASLSVQYTYTAIPEPSSYAALAGLAALGFVTIRRRKA